MKRIGFSFMLAALLLCSCGVSTWKGPITVEMAYEGVENYCHSEYDWSVAEENPNMMKIEMGEETDSAYQVVFHSYTGALVYFYVEKASGTTKIVEYVPNLDVKNEVGTINLLDYTRQFK